MYPTHYTSFQRKEEQVMSLNSLFFDYDKLAKDGVVETIDWRNPPDSDDDSSGDDGIRTLDDTVNDVNDKIKRSDDIAADLKRTIDSIKQSGKVSQEDRIALEAFTKSVDFKGLPSLESYTLMPSRVNCDKTLQVSMEVHAALVAGGIAAVILLISKVIDWFTGDGDSGSGGGGGNGKGGGGDSGSGGSKSKSPMARAAGDKNKQSKVVSLHKRYTDAYLDYGDAVKGLTHEMLNDIKVACNLSKDDEVLKKYEGRKGVALLNARKQILQIFNESKDYAGLTSSSPAMWLLMRTLNGKVSNFDKLSVHSSSVGIVAINKLKAEVPMLLKAYNNVTNAINNKKYDEVNRYVHEYKPTWQAAYSTEAVPTAISSAKKVIEDSINDKLEFNDQNADAFYKIVETVLFGKWIKNYICDDVEELAVKMSEVKSKLESVKHQVETDNDNEANKIGKHVQHLINMTTPQATLLIRINNHYFQMSQAVVTFCTRAESLTKTFKSFDKAYRNEI